MQKMPCKITSRAKNDICSIIEPNSPLALMAAGAA